MFLCGAKEIKARFNMTDRTFSILLNLGLPHKRINGRIYAHSENIDLWLRQLTAQVGDLDNIPDGPVNETGDGG